MARYSNRKKRERRNAIASKRRSDIYSDAFPPLDSRAASPVSARPASNNSRPAQRRRDIPIGDLIYDRFSPQKNVSFQRQTFSSSTSQKRAAVTPDRPTLAQNDLTQTRLAQWASNRLQRERASELDLRKEKVQDAPTCKPRPKSNKSKGGGSRNFIPWCG